MPFKIRTKLILAFFAVIFPFIAIFGAIALYNVSNIRNASSKAEAISEELNTVVSLQLAIEKSLMPGNDYIITGDKKYIDDFNVASRDVEDLIKKVEEILVHLKGMETPKVKEEMEIIKGVRTAWRNIKEISQKIFAIQNPFGNKDAARLMEEMDYQWAYPAIKMLEKHYEIDIKERAEALEELQRQWMMAWIIMVGGAIVLIASSVFFAFYYSRLFTRPIETIHSDVDAVARGDFKKRLDIQTGDELEQLANAMNQMADNLQKTTVSRNELTKEVEERKRAENALRDSSENLNRLLNSLVEGVYGVDTNGNCTFVNQSCLQTLGYQNNDEVLGKHMHTLMHHSHSDGSPYPVSECRIYRAYQTLETIHVSDEVFWRKDGSSFPAEYWSRSIVVDGEAVGAIITFVDITESKKAEKELQEQIEILERFRKATVQREFRIKELRDENEELKRKLGIHKV